jgi:hypothetical protein
VGLGNLRSQVRPLSMACCYTPTALPWPHPALLRAVPFQADNLAGDYRVAHSPDGTVSRLLADQGVQVIAVESGAEMRQGAIPYAIPIEVTPDFRTQG